PTLKDFELSSEEMDKLKAEMKKKLESYTERPDLQELKKAPLLDLARIAIVFNFKEQFEKPLESLIEKDYKNQKRSSFVYRSTPDSTEYGGYSSFNNANMTVHEVQSISQNDGGYKEISLVTFRGIMDFHIQFTSSSAEYLLLNPGEIDTTKAGPSGAGFFCLGIFMGDIDMALTGKKPEVVFTPIMYDGQNLIVNFDFYMAFRLKGQGSEKTALVIDGGVLKIPFSFPENLKEKFNSINRGTDL
ncbi:hypothetical protein ACFL2G_04670, partial [Candidatus Omnitrophota bacterium]